jgi:hypothetical protein
MGVNIYKLWGYRNCLYNTDGETQKEETNSEIWERMENVWCHCEKIKLASMDKVITLCIFGIMGLISRGTKSTFQLLGSLEVHLHLKKATAFWLRR